MANYNATENIEALAADIGDNIYIDIAKWHLYLSNAKLHTVVAQKVYPLLEDDSLTEDKVTAILQDIPVQLGEGKKELPLIELIPNRCQRELMELLEEYQSKL